MGNCSSSSSMSSSSSSTTQAQSHGARRTAARQKSRSRGQLAATALVAVLILVAGCAEIGGGGGGGLTSRLSSCAPIAQQIENDPECVRAMQNAFYILGEAVEVDGSFGPRTAEAVRSFQRSRGLAVDGVAGSNTLAKLDAALPYERRFETASGVLTCGDVFGSCTYYFDHTTTDSIYRAAEQAGNASAVCLLLKDPRVKLACDLLGSFGGPLLADIAGTAVQENGCLTIDVRQVEIRSDTSGYCRR